jgi:hypothetical protein
MARRAVSALVVVLAVGGLALPADLLTGQSPAAAATGRPQSESLVAISITSMTPQWATPGATITVSGTLRNTSAQQDSHLTVQLLRASAAISSVAQLAQNASTATTPVRGASWQSTGQLAPGATVNWSIRLPAGNLGMRTFGVYPLAAQVQSALGTALAATTTYLPYMPAKKGAAGRSRPSPAKIAWIWPLIDKPLLNEPWQNNCTGPQARALAQSLSSGGRLSDLVRAGASVAAYDGLTWAVDPALLANARALTTCSTTSPQWATAASAWLSELRTATAGRPVTATPYGDPNVTALINAGRGADVMRSFTLGRALAGRIMRRDMSPGATGGTPAVLTEAAGIAWPAGGPPGYTALENLAIVDGVHTVVVSSSAVPAAAHSVLRTPNGGGGYINLLLASDSLTQLLGATGGTPGSAFATAQEFLAETALLAQHRSSQPIVVAPPRRWGPTTGLAADLLAETASAPWLSPVSLASLTSGKKVQNLTAADLPADTTGHAPVSKTELRELRALNREIAELQSIKALPDADLYLAVSTVESSAWQGTAKATAKAMLTALADRIAVEQRAVQIVAEPRITLGGLKGSVPVSIENRLGYAVRVRLKLHFSQVNGIRITADPNGLVTVAARTTRTIRLRVQAVQVGSTTITMQLASQAGRPLVAAAERRMTIQATQVGVLGMIILAAALGIFLIANAARAVRGGRPGTPAEQQGDDDPTSDHDDDRGAEHAEPDTVMAERSQLGAAPGTSGP